MSFRLKKKNLFLTGISAKRTILTFTRITSDPQCYCSLQNKIFFVESFRMAFPRKFLLKDLVNKPPPMEVWLQGTIEQTVGKDILIISDGFGRAKITKCEFADGVINKNSLQKGTYCCIIGTAIKTKGLPEIQASKFIDLSLKPHMKDAWENEVREADLLLRGEIHPAV